MYSLSRRITVSAIIPILVLCVSLPYLIQNYSQIALIDILIFLTTLIIGYIAAVFFFSAETLFRYFVTDKNTTQRAEFVLEASDSSLSEKVRLIESHDQSPLISITHSVLFQVLLLIVTFYTITSSGSLLGSILTLSLVLQILVDQVLLIMKDPSRLASWTWQLNQPVSHTVEYSLIAATSIVLLVGTSQLLQALP